MLGLVEDEQPSSSLAFERMDYGIDCTITYPLLSACMHNKFTLSRPFPTKIASTNEFHLQRGFNMALLLKK